MGLFIKQNQERTELQQRVAAELQQKLKRNADIQAKKPEEAILENQHETRLAGKVIMILVLLLVIALIVFALRAGGII